MPSTCHRRLTSLLITGAVLWYAGCGGSVAPPAPGETPPRAGSAETKPAPDVTLVDLDGAEWRLAEGAGQVRLVDFWATWCAPCREEIPMFKELYETYKDRGFTLLAVSDESPEVLREFVARHQIPYPNLIGNEEVSERFGVLALPMAFLVDGEGRIVKTFVGPKPRRVFESAIEALLAPPAAP